MNYNVKYCDYCDTCVYEEEYEIREGQIVCGMCLREEDDKTKEDPEEIY
jgi:formylmethanofuran dehydrogenase subunit E